MAFITPNQAQIASNRPLATTPWVRPSDWISITDTPNEVQFLVSDFNGFNSYGLILSFTRPATQNLYVDWGDGIIDTIAAGTTLFHNYTSGGTPSTQGYNTWKIRVWTDAGATITNCKPTYGQRFGTLNYPGICVGVLEAYFGDGVNITQWQQFFKGVGTTGIGNSNANFNVLQYVKMPSVITGSCDFTETFLSCNKLAKVILPTSATGATTYLAMFRSCLSLQSVSKIPEAPNATSISQMFSFCSNLTSVSFPSSMPLVTTCADIFNGCALLNNIQLPSLPACTSYSQAFIGMTSLQSIQITAFTSTAQAINLNNAFGGCNSIEQIILPATLPSGSELLSATLTNTFQNCFNLKSVVLPNNINAPSLASCFLNCYSLCNVSLPTNMNLLTSMANTFQNCNNLQSITLPTSVGATITLATTFSGCRAITGITIPSSYVLTSLNATFNQCNNLITISLPNNAQNSLTTIASMCAACITLTGITMPTSLNACTDISSAFGSTYYLNNVSFPSSMPALTTMVSAFSSSGVKSVSLPSSTPLLTSMAGLFQNAFNIEDVVLPASVATNCVMSQVVWFATALKSITFPTTSTTGITDLTNVIRDCANLQTINNIVFLGNSGTTTTNYITATNGFNNLSSFTGTLDFYCKFAKLDIQGLASTQKNSITGLRLRNNGSGQYGGTSPHINISNTNLSQAALVQVFNDLPTITAKTINITNATGASSLTAGERAIATGKGWTIVG